MARAQTRVSDSTDVDGHDVPGFWYLNFQPAARGRLSSRSHCRSNIGVRLWRSARISREHLKYELALT